MSEQRRSSKRLSRYSTAAVLDPDSDIIDKAHPEWWKQLEDTSVIPSWNSIGLNETSRHLNPDSEIIESQVSSNWYKYLDDSSIPEINKMMRKEGSDASSSKSVELSKPTKKRVVLHSRTNENRASQNEQDLDMEDSSISISLKMSRSDKEDDAATDNISTSASEEVSRIRKKKLPFSLMRKKDKEASISADEFQKVMGDSSNSKTLKVGNTSKIDFSKMAISSNASTSESEEITKPVKKRFVFPSQRKRNRSNVFLDILNNSTTATSHVTEKSDRRSINDHSSASASKINTVDDSGETSENNSTLNKNKILKSKPSIFKRNYKNKSQNLFDLVLKNNEPGTSSKEKSITMDSVNETHIMSQNVNFAAESSQVELSPDKILPSSTVIARSDIPKTQTRITSFFKTDELIPASQLRHDKELLEKIRQKMNKIKERDLSCMEKEEEVKLKTSAKKKIINVKNNAKTKKKPKEVDKAFLVNGEVYKPRKLPRPHPWVTNRLYKYLQKCLEPKYNIRTRVKSERFVRQMSNIATLIMKSKSYSDYETEMKALMKEMARLGIIRSRRDFYNFCQDFFPYELRVKTVPMLLPGNEKTIPYDPNGLDDPLLP